MDQGGCHPGEGQDAADEVLCAAGQHTPAVAWTHCSCGIVWAYWQQRCVHEIVFIAAPHKHTRSCYIPRPACSPYAALSFLASACSCGPQLICLSCSLKEFVQLHRSMQTLCTWPARHS